jgi:hypothetical protein
MVNWDDVDRSDLTYAETVTLVPVGMKMPSWKRLAVLAPLVLVVPRNP